MNSRFVTELAAVDNPRLERLRKADHNIHAPALPAASGFPGCAADQKRGVCSGSFLLHTRMSSAEILHAIYSSDSIRYPFPDHIWLRRGCEFPEGLIYAGIVFYRNHQ